MTKKPVGLKDFKIEMVPIDQLKPYERNAKAHPEAQVDKIARSIKEFGIAKNIVINADNLILAGHGSVLAYKKLGVGVAPCYRMTHLSPAQERGFSLADNRTAESSWFPETLALELKALEEMDFDLGLTGFDLDELEAFGIGQGGEPPPEDPGPQIDRAAELQEKWQTCRGQIWTLPSLSTPGKAHRVMCGDSTSAEDVGRLIKGADVAVVSDPPYGINVDTSWLSALHIQRGKPACKSDDRLQNDDGSLDLSWIYNYREWLVFGFPFIARGESWTGLLVWDKRGDGGEAGLGNPVEVAASNCFNGYRLVRHVWAGYVREAGEKREPHPTQKPIGTMRDAIELVKSANIYDPFLGSGTTLIAAEQLGRVAYGMEISPEYCGVILERAAGIGLVPQLLSDGAKE